MIGLAESLKWFLPYKWTDFDGMDRWMAAQDGSDERFGLLAAFAFGFLEVYGWADRIDSLVMRIIASVILGPVAGLVLYYVGGGLLNWVLRLFGGIGSVAATRSGISLTSVPVLWVMASAVLFRTAAATLNAPETLRQPVAGVLALLLAAALIWSAGLLVVLLSKAHKITGVRVFAALVLAGVILSGPGLACAGPISIVL